ncbi:CocE/NonD family hydrolase [Pseudooceanicola sp.]|uniref:CocE/NonD family hydrolase n=1 Tax=Pseudooceanicola sp. TaxID=1914328 RepID=UPI0040599430
MRVLIVALVVLAVLAALGLWQRDRIEGVLRAQKAEWEHGRAVAAMGAERLEAAMVPMPDGVRLATDVYLPEGAEGPLPAILMRLPYGKTRFGEVRKWMRTFVPEGYAVVVQDMRGRYDSEGVWAPYPDEAGDGAATLDWIAGQDWSDGRVGTIGCSALGETQLMLATGRHPAHRAMIPMGAGGAIGTLDGAYGFFGFFEGGILNLASGFGWFVAAGGKTPDRMGKPPVDYAQGLATLPVREAVARFRDDPTDYTAMLDQFDDPAYWAQSGFIEEEDRFATPFLIVDNWYDGARESLQLARHMRDTGAEGTALILPGLHCDMGWIFDTGAVGDMAVDPAQGQDFDALFVGFMDHHLKGAPAPDLPPVRYYLMGEDRWMDAAQWPPAGARTQTLFLDGETLAEAPGAAGARRFTSDPADPVPTIGGTICCTGDPDQRAGPLDQRPIEGRADLLVLTGPELAAPLRIVGPMRAHLTVSANVPDADLVVRLTDVAPDGTSLMIQEGALRLRYRDGFDAPKLMVPGQTYAVTVDMRDIAYTVPAGHRLRLHVAGSSFPRLARNMQSGGNPYAEATPHPAEITVHTGPEARSRLELSILPDG